MVEVNLCKYSFAKVKAWRPDRLDSIWWMAAPNLLTVRLNLDQAGSLWNADKNLTTNGGHSQSSRAMSVRSGWVACWLHLGHSYSMPISNFICCRHPRHFMPTSRHFRIEPGYLQSSMLMLENCVSQLWNRRWQLHRDAELAKMLPFFHQNLMASKAAAWWPGNDFARDKAEPMWYLSEDRCLGFFARNQPEVTVHFRTNSVYWYKITHSSTCCGISNENKNRAPNNKQETTSKTPRKKNTATKNRTQIVQIFVMHFFFPWSNKSGEHRRSEETIL